MTAARIVPAGDSMLLVEFEARIDEAINRCAVALARSITDAAMPGIRDVVPAYRSVAVYFDPLKTDAARLTRFLRERLRSTASADGPVDERNVAPIRIPVVYGGNAGPDLEDVAAHAHMTPGDIVALHCARPYRAFMLGFLPGFAYLAPVDARIAMPRLATPRSRVPAGSVGIAGPQTGIYPSESPGGWRLIGRTRVRPFDPARAEPFLIKPGDRVQFYPVEAGTD